MVAITALCPNMVFSKQQAQLIISKNVSPSYSLGNPFSQIKLTQSLSSGVNISASATIQPRSVVDSQLVWNTQTIPVCWTNLDPNRATEHGWVQNAANRWRVATNNQLTFTGWGLCNGVSPDGIKITVDNSHPRSLVGIDSRAANPSMWLNFFVTNPAPNGFETCRTGTESNRQNCIESIAAHEFGHALGFQHEQDSTLTPQTCLDQLGIKTTPQAWLGVLTLTNQWDANSIMNYCNTVWNNNGQLSRLDQMAVKTWYGNISNYSTWNNTLNIPVIDINGTKASAILVFNGSSFAITSLVVTNPNSASEAVFANNMLHIPMLRLQEQQILPNFITDLYDAWFSYNPSNGLLTLTSANPIR